MNCEYCGYFNEEPTDTCGRCGAEIPEPTCQQCGTPVDWGTVLCEQCEKMSRTADRTPCPSCGSLNDVSAEYCTSCGTPMAVMTQVTELARAEDRDALETWRVYGIETELVGRDDELGELLETFRHVAEAREVRTVAVTGDTGFGKSRLLAEFQRRAEEESPDSLVLESAEREDSSGPFAIFERLFKNRFYIGTDESPEAARRKFADAVESLVESPRAEAVAHLVGYAIGLPFEDSPHVADGADGETPGEFDRRSVEAMAELIEADARESSLIVALEDLQYAEPRTLRLLNRLIRTLEDVPVLFTATWNPKDLHAAEAVEQLSVDRSLELRALADEDVESFVRQTLHKAEQVPEELVQRIVDAAHGVPLSVEEILRILIDEGVVDTRREPWTIDVDRVDEVALPTTVEETVRTRLASLEEDERRVLEMAACAGDEFWPRLVQALYHLRLDREDGFDDRWFDDELSERVADVLESLERKDMVRHRDGHGPGGDDRLTFKHRLEREAIYDEISDQMRERYHRLAAQWLEREVDDRELDRFAERIARHYDRGGALEAAADMYVRAAEFEASRFSNDKAVELFTAGLGYLGDARIDSKLSAFHDLGSLYVRLGEYDQALAYFREMLRYAWLLNDSAKGGAALNKIGRAYRSLGQYDEALEHLDRALDMFWDVSDLRGVASTLDDIGKIHWIRGDYSEALRYYTSGLELRRDEGHRRSIALSLSNLGSLKLRRGALDDARELYREALQIRREIDDRRGVAASHNDLGALFLMRGATEDATERFERAVAIAREVGHRFMQASALNNLGEARLAADELEKAESHLEQAKTLAESAGSKRVSFDVVRNLGRLALARESFQLAHDRARETIEMAGELGSESLMGRARSTLADVFAEWCRAGGGDTMQQNAEQNFEIATEQLRQVGEEADLAETLARYGEFLVDRQQCERGRRRLERAAELFESLGLDARRQEVGEELESLRTRSET